MFKTFDSVSSIVKHANEMLEIKKKIIQYFIDNPWSMDSDVHTLAKDLKIEESKLHDAIYALLGSFLGGGASFEYEGEYDLDELEKGKDVELEHLSQDNDDEINQLLAEKISKDHLAEFQGKLYYTLLLLTEEILREVLTKNKRGKHEIQ